MKTFRFKRGIKNNQRKTFSLFQETVRSTKIDGVWSRSTIVQK